MNSVQSHAVVIVNSNDRAWTSTRFILSFGAYGDLRLMVWANHIEDALDEAIDWIAANAPGLLCDDAVHERYRELIASGVGEDEAAQEAEVDTTCGGNAGHYLNSWEWGIVGEYPVAPKRRAL